MSARGGQASAGAGLEGLPSASRSQDRTLLHLQGQAAVAAVVDGAGGTSGGEAAAERVLAALQAHAARGPALADPLAWAALLNSLDGALPGQAAVTVVAVGPFGLAGAAVGDVALFRVAGGGLTLLTEGLPRKPLLGSGGVATPLSDPEATGRWLLASDGLWKYAPGPALAAKAAQVPADAAGAAALLGLARLPSGGLQDDASAVLLERA